MEAPAWRRPPALEDAALDGAVAAAPAAAKDRGAVQPSYSRALTAAQSRSRPSFQELITAGSPPAAAAAAPRGGGSAAARASHSAGASRSGGGEQDGPGLAPGHPRAAGDDGLFGHVEEVRLADAAGAEAPPPGLPRAVGDDDQPSTPGAGAAWSPPSTPSPPPPAHAAAGGARRPPEAGAPSRPPRPEGAASPHEPRAPEAEDGSWTGQVATERTGELDDDEEYPVVLDLLGALEEPPRLAFPTPAAEGVGLPAASQPAARVARTPFRTPAASLPGDAPAFAAWRASPSDSGSPPRAAPAGALAPATQRQLRAAVEALSALDASLRGPGGEPARPAAAAGASAAARLAAAQAEAEDARREVERLRGCPRELALLSSSRLHQLQRDLAESLRRVSCELEGRAKCCVCRAEDREVVLNPCMHLVLCRACAERVALCPICRREVISHMPVTIS